MTNQDISRIADAVTTMLVEENYIGQHTFAKAHTRLVELVNANPAYTVATLYAYCLDRYAATAHQFTAEEKEANRRASEEFARKRRNEPWQEVGPCIKCGGDGIFWLKGPSEDGKAPQLIPGKCYPCAGKGHMTEADVKRTTNYYRYFYTVPQ